MRTMTYDTSGQWPKLGHCGVKLMDQLGESDYDSSDYR